MTTFTFHCGPGGNRTGLGQHWRDLNAAGIAVATKSADDYGPCFELLRDYGHRPTTTAVFRLTTAGQNDGVSYDVPDYHLTPDEAAARHWAATLAKLPQEFDRRRCWVEPINEVDKNRADWLGRFAVAIANLAHTDGYRVSLFGWSAGEPESEHWATPGMVAYLRLCAERPGQAAVALHEYSYADDLASARPHLIGRFQRLHAVCDALSIARPTIHITEWGWRHQWVPDPDTAVAQLRAVRPLYDVHRNIAMVATWHLGGGSQWAGIADKAQKLIAPVTALQVAEPPPPATDPPPAGGWVRVAFEGFEGGEGSWYQHENRQEMQVYNGFEINYHTGTTNGYTLPETRVVPRSQIPSHEQPLYFWPGPNGEPSNWTIKLFGLGGRPINLRYNTQPASLPAGRYRLVIPYFADIVKGYAGGSKLFDPDPRACQLRAYWNGVKGDYTVVAPYGRRAEFISEYDHPGGELKFGFRVDMPIQQAHNGNNGIFFDAWRLYLADDVVEPPPDPDPPPRPTAVKHTMHLIDQAAPVDGVTALTAQLHATRSAFTYSHDVAYAVLYHSLQGGRLILYTPHTWNEATLRPFRLLPITIEERPLPVGGPTPPPDPDPDPEPFRFTHWPTQHKVITQAFDANPQNYARFGLPGHEGVDIRAPHGSDIYAAHSGTISELHPIETSHNYGIFVRVRSDVDPNYESTYAHLASINANMYVGRLIQGGERLGLADSTGNSPGGPHSHLTLKHEEAVEGGSRYINYPHKIIDPTPYLSPLLDQPPAPATIDLLPYLRGDGRRYYLRSADGRTQEIAQCQADGPLVWYQAKNAQWERFEVSDDYIRRDTDISPGGGRYYTQREGAVYARWLPRRMTVGQPFTVSLRVQFYQMANCAPSAANSGDVVDTRRLVARHPTWVSGHGVIVHDVVEIQWVNGGETYFYGRDHGLVGWQRTHQDPNTPQWTAISEYVQGGHNERLTGCFN